MAGCRPACAACRAAACCCAAAGGTAAQAIPAAQLEERAKVCQHRLVLGDGAIGQQQLKADNISGWAACTGEQTRGQPSLYKCWYWV